MEILIAVVFLISFIPGGIIRRKYRKKSQNLPTRKPPIENKNTRILTYAFYVTFSTLYAFLAPIFLLFNIYHPIFDWASLAFLIPSSAVLIALQIIGLCLYITGYVLYVIARLEIKEWFAELWMPSKLGEGFTSTGIYRHIRHPLYTGGILFSFGIIIIFQTWFGLLLFLYPLLIMLRTASKEESLLLERFGEQYEQYMKCTGKFLPKLKRAVKEKKIL